MTRDEIIAKLRETAFGIARQGTRLAIFGPRARGDTRAISTY
jgi:hypothetical protein